jgi:predicted AlkP superfamily phosphohydrolase/phosphomutase
MSTQTRQHRIIVLEINEISWDLMEPWLADGQLPNFRRLRDAGCCGTTTTDEPGGPDGLLEPWVTWTTFYTGVPYTEHGLRFLEQPADTIHAKRLWEILPDAGKSVGVFGSSNSWPPPPVNGFVIPGSFSPDSQTYPESLQPIQDLNLQHTRAHVPGAKSIGLTGSALKAIRLVRHGLNASTVIQIVKCLREIRRHPDRDWKKVSLQPIVNFAFFSKLYRRVRPDFATFHTNHVAHYQHRFFRAWKPELFPDPTAAEEVQRFGGAIAYGYQVADRLLGQFMQLADRARDVILCVASSMGQKAYIPDKYNQVAPPTCRVRSIERLITVLGLDGQCEYFSTMAPQWNIRIPEAQLRTKTIGHLLAARYQPQGKSMYSAMEVADSIVLTPMSHHGVGGDSVCCFPTLAGTATLPFHELAVQADDTRKSGCHDPIGMLAFYGTPVRTGHLPQVNNIDVAPTLLALLGVPAPPFMRGRVFANEVLCKG